MTSPLLFRVLLLATTISFLLGSACTGAPGPSRTLDDHGLEVESASAALQDGRDGLEAVVNAEACIRSGQYQDQLEMSASFLRGGEPAGWELIDSTQFADWTETPCAALAGRLPFGLDIGDASDVPLALRLSWLDEVSVVVQSRYLGGCLSREQSDLPVTGGEGAPVDCD